MSAHESSASVGETTSNASVGEFEAPIRRWDRRKATSTNPLSEHCHEMSRVQPGQETDDLLRIVPPLNEDSLPAVAAHPLTCNDALSQQ